MEREIYPVWYTEKHRAEKLFNDKGYQNVYNNLGVLDWDEAFALIHLKNDVLISKNDF